MHNTEKLKAWLEKEAAERNRLDEVSYSHPDPLLVASRYNDERIALICALFAYGNARQIVAFLDRLDFSLLEEKEDVIVTKTNELVYRFQKPIDVAALFIALKRLNEIDTIENLFYEGYRKENSILDGLHHFLSILHKVYPHQSYGYRFLTGKIPKSWMQAGTYKRYMMYLRWMVRRDALDMGLWHKIDKKDLLMPLDTHTYHTARALGLLRRKSYDMKAVFELTERFREWDSADPVKYDFALYRIGQEKKRYICSD